MTTQKKLADLEPVISAKAIEKSGRVLKALSLLYLPFHGLNPSDLFEFYGPIAFVSCAVYQSDELNECEDIGFAPSLKAIRDYLANRGLLDEVILQYLEDGEDYLTYERRLRITRPQSIDEILSIMRLRSSDFRILHCLLHRFVGKAYSPATFAAYEAFELLMEVDDDILSYRDDLDGGTFNFLQALSLLPATDAKGTAEVLRQKIIEKTESACSSLPKQYSVLFAKILAVYRDLVPKPKIPSERILTTTCGSSG